MARILFLTQVLPYPLNTGARVRQYYVLRHLSQKHEVTLISFVRADDQVEHIAHLRTFCQSIHSIPMIRSRWCDGQAAIKGLATGKPIVITRDEVKSMRQLLTGLLASEHFDVIHADQVSMAQYGLRGQGLRRVLDLHNAMYLVTRRLAEHESNSVKRLIAQRETRALANYEARLCSQYDQITFVTEEDRRAIESELTRRRLPIPTDRFTTIPICSDPSDKLPVKPTLHPHRVTVLGVMFWPPNAEGALWFAQEAWPAVRAEFPDSCLTIVGKNPPQSLLDLNGMENVEVTGYVPDLDQLLAETAVFIVPLRAGGGMRVKILDAWCWGLPIVSTSIGAEGIAIRSGENILIADTANDFAQAVRRVLGDPRLANNLRRNGRQWIEEHYDWQRVYAIWDNVYAKALNE